MEAIAVFDDGIKGNVKFTENGNNVRIDIELSGLSKNGIHGFHVHETGNLTRGCESLCAHFNPYGNNHGAPGDRDRHVGDLGNIISDKNGNCTCVFYDRLISLRGHKRNVIGRGLVIHEDIDDLGRGGNDKSLTTGNAGKRIACAIIGCY